MHAGGVTETIWHFIGYLHLADSVARAPTLYEGDPQPSVPPVFHDLPLEPLRGLAFDELVSLPTTAYETVAPRASSSPDYDLSPAGFAAAGRTAPSVVPSLKHIPFQGDDHGFALRIPPKFITVEYREGGDESLIQIRQVNIQNDRDLITSDDIRYADGSEKTIQIKCRIDTAIEIEYVENGGVLHYVLRNLAQG